MLLQLPHMAVVVYAVCMRVDSNAHSEAGMLRSHSGIVREIGYFLSSQVCYEERSMSSLQLV